MDKNMTRTLTYQGQGHGDCDKTTIQEGKNKKRTRTLTYWQEKKDNGCGYIFDSMRKTKNTEKDMDFLKYNQPLGREFIKRIVN
jgi:hypothetical protein